MLGLRAVGGDNKDAGTSICAVEGQNFRKIYSEPVVQERFTVLNSNKLVHETLIGELGKEGRDHVDSPINDYQGAELLRDGSQHVIGSSIRRSSGDSFYQQIRQSLRERSGLDEYIITIAIAHRGIVTLPDDTWKETKELL